MDVKEREALCERGPHGSMSGYSCVVILMLSQEHALA